VKTVFADTGYWIALLHPRDELHTIAKEVSASLGRVQLITSEMVLTKLLNSFAPRGMYLRQAASTIIEQLYKDANTTVVPQTSILFKQALRAWIRHGAILIAHASCSKRGLPRRLPTTSILNKQDSRLC